MKTKAPVIYKKKPQALPKKASLELYLKEIARFPLLTKEEEKKLSLQFYQTKEIHIAQILAQANLRFVVKIAMEYTRFGARLIDLIQEGNIGLLQAIKQFNPYKGVRLITYAVWWIRGYIQGYLLKQYSLVRMGTNTQQKKLFYLLKKQQEDLPALPHKQINLLSLGLQKGFKAQHLQEMQTRIKEKDISLDQPAFKNTTTKLIEMQNSKEESSAEEQLNLFQETTLLKQSIQQLRPFLSKIELFILDNRLLCEKPLTLQKIGDKYQFTREYIRQKEKQLLQKIKNKIQSYHSSSVG